MISGRLRNRTITSRCCTAEVISMHNVVLRVALYLWLDMLITNRIPITSLSKVLDQYYDQ